MTNLDSCIVPVVKSSDCLVHQTVIFPSHNIKFVLSLHSYTYTYMSTLIQLPQHICYSFNKKYTLIYIYNYNYNYIVGQSSFDIPKSFSLLFLSSSPFTINYLYHPFIITIYKHIHSLLSLSFSLPLSFANSTSVLTTTTTTIIYFFINKLCSTLDKTTSFKSFPSSSSSACLFFRFIDL